jgi:hypothetical protein
MQGLVSKLSVFALNVFGLSAAPIAECFGCGVFWIVTFFGIFDCIFIFIIAF